MRISKTVAALGLRVVWEHQEMMQCKDHFEYGPPQKKKRFRRRYFKHHMRSFEMMTHIDRFRVNALIRGRRQLPQKNCEMFLRVVRLEQVLFRWHPQDEKIRCTNQ